MLVTVRVTIALDGNFFDQNPEKHMFFGSREVRFGVTVKIQELPLMLTDAAIKNMK
jgi:hypothetical protein